MRHTIGSFLVLLAILLNGCTSYPLPKVGYDKPASVASDRIASLSFTSGIAEGYSATTIIPAGGTFVPVGGGAAPSWINFNQEDQAIFVACLQEELDRLGILKIASPRSSLAADIGLKISFERTIKNPGNDYRLQVKLEIQTPVERFAKSYNVRSFEGESGWATFNVTPTTGKKMAAQKLLDAMIPDIEAAVRGLAKTTVPSS